MASTAENLVFCKKKPPYIVKMKTTYYTGLLNSKIFHIAAELVRAFGKRQRCTFGNRSFRSKREKIRNTFRNNSRKISDCQCNAQASVKPLFFRFIGNELDNAFRYGKLVHLSVEAGETRVNAGNNQSCIRHSVVPQHVRNGRCIFKTRYMHRNPEVFRRRKRLPVSSEAYCRC